MEESTGREGKRARTPPPEEAIPTPATAPDDVQEEDIEKFFVLLGNIKALRDHFLKADDQRKRLKHDEAAPPPWKPTFELEDFRHAGGEAESSTAACRPPEHNSLKGEEKRDANKEEVAEKSKSSLNLNLSLDFNL